MNTNIKVSIVVAVYNAEKDLPKCLDSLISQTYDNIEIVCVDDCSTDNSLQVLNEYARKDPRFIIVHHDVNQNAGGAYNDGILTASGDYVCIVDNDDWLSENAIEVLVQESEFGKYDIVGPSRNSVFSETVLSVSNTFPLGDDRNQILTHALKHGFAIIGDLIRRDVFIKKNLQYPTNVFYEDIAIGYCILFYASHIKGINNPLYFYSHVPTSVTAKPSQRKIEDRIRTTDLLLTNLKEGGFYETEYKELIEFKYLTYSAYTMIMLCKLDWKEARPLFKTLKERIAQFLPNAYLNDAPFRTRMILKFPTVSYLLGFLYVRLYKGRR